MLPSSRVVASVSIRSTLPEDIDDLLLEMRAVDRAECAAYGLGDPAQRIRDGARNSPMCWTARDKDGHLICVFGVGVVSLLTGTGSPWMLATDRLVRHAKTLQRTVPAYIELMRWMFPRLINFVHCDNRTSIDWLRRLGFQIHAPVRFGFGGELFHPFDMGVSDV